MQAALNQAMSDSGQSACARSLDFPAFLHLLESDPAHNEAQSLMKFSSQAPRSSLWDMPSLKTLHALDRSIKQHLRTTRSKELKTPLASIQSHEVSGPLDAAASSSQLLDHHGASSSELQPETVAQAGGIGGNLTSSNGVELAGTQGAVLSDDTTSQSKSRVQKPPLNELTGRGNEVFVSQLATQMQASLHSNQPLLTRQSHSLGDRVFNNMDAAGAGSGGMGGGGGQVPAAGFGFADDDDTGDWASQLKRWREKGEAFAQLHRSAKMGVLERHPTPDACWNTIAA